MMLSYSLPIIRSADCPFPKINMCRNVYLGSLTDTLISLRRAFVLAIVRIKQYWQGRLEGKVKSRESCSLLPPVLEPPAVITQYISVLSVSSQIAVLSRFVLLLLVCFGCRRCIAGAALTTVRGSPPSVTSSSSSSFTDTADGRYQQFTRSARHQYIRQSPCPTRLFHPPNALRCRPLSLPLHCRAVVCRIHSYTDTHSCVFL